ncbi:MAG: hypothetical protein U1F25_18490 [Rubrivivax sp.]
MQAAPVVIEGVRLRLRRSTPADAAEVFRLTADAQVMAHLDFPANRLSPTPPRTCKAARRAGRRAASTTA